MYQLLYFIVSFGASIVGSICGMGGGIIIKPVLDAVGIMDIATIGFLSGITVLAMSTLSIGKLAVRQQKGLVPEAETLEFATTVPLAVGAVLGGILGRTLLSSALRGFSPRSLGILQASLILILTAFSLLYTLFSSRITTRQITGAIPSAVIGLILGTMSSFLGIGGGPINLVVLAFFFSMNTKKAASNSLFIILFSQLANFIQTAVSGQIPPVGMSYLLLMIAGGLSGAQVGGMINKKLSVKSVDRLFTVVMTLLVFLNIYNIIKLV